MRWNVAPEARNYLKCHYRLCIFLVEQTCREQESQNFKGMMMTDWARET